MKERVLVAMSGGVDSSVAAYLLKEAGYECVGATMRLFSNDLAGLSGESTCCSLDDIEDARSVCARLGFPHITLDLGEDFRRCVLDKFVSEYTRGRTPNPCIDCNRYLKFDRLLQKARELGCGYVATGHYAIRAETPDGLALMKARDRSKDQSYVLYTLTPEKLRQVLLPLGELTKDEVRAIAREQGFINAKKRDSQDICFIPDGDYLGFIERYTGKKSDTGRLIDSSGRVIGTHRGAAGYTIGQRRGLGVSAERPLYVAAKNMEENTVTLDFEEGLYTKSLIATDFCWIDCPQLPARCAAKTRYRQREAPAEVSECDKGVLLTFDEPQRAVTPGQAAVLYDGEHVLGGGTILRAF